MKQITLLTLLVTVMMAACNTSNKAAQEKQDSIQSAAAADSMLRDVLKSESLDGDTVKANALKR